MSDIVPPSSASKCQLSLPVGSNSSDDTNIVINASVINDTESKCAQKLRDSVAVEIANQGEKRLIQVEEDKECRGSANVTVRSGKSILLSVGDPKSVSVTVSVRPWRIRPLRSDYSAGLVKTVDDKGMEGQLVLGGRDSPPLMWVHAHVGHSVEIRILKTGLRTYHYLFFTYSILTNSSVLQTMFLSKIITFLPRCPFDVL